MDFIGKVLIFLILIVCCSWLTHQFHKKKRCWLALTTLIVAVSGVVMLFNPDSYADSQSNTASTAVKESSSKREESKKTETKQTTEESHQQTKEAAVKASVSREKEEKQKEAEQKEKAQLTSLPQYEGKPYVEINHNTPYFPESDCNTQSFEKYSDLDSLGRCGVAYANISQSTMPTGKRQPIGNVKPSGWHTVRYSNVDGKYLYNRCHLIGYQLTAENANPQNLITGTRYLNVEGMLPFENMVADYIKATNHHVLYRVTPYFSGDDLVVRGVQIEAKSVEDNGKGILFNVYCFNVQPGVEIDYANGESQLTDPNAEEAGTTSSTVSSSTMQEASPTQAAPASQANATEGKVRGNCKSKIYHLPGQHDYDKMGSSPNLVVFNSPSEAEAQGYRQAKR